MDVDSDFYVVMHLDEFAPVGRRPRAGETRVQRGVPDHIRSDNGKLRDELLDREAIDTLLEANGAICALAAAKCLGLPAPGASRRGWSIGGQNPDLRTGVIHGGRSHW